MIMLGCSSRNARILCNDNKLQLCPCDKIPQKRKQNLSIYPVSQEQYLFMNTPLCVLFIVFCFAQYCAPIIIPYFHLKSRLGQSASFSKNTADQTAT